MEASKLLIDAFGRIQEAVHEILVGLSDEDLMFRPDENANSIAWLVWHLTRIQDDHIAELAAVEQTWLANGWNEKFNLPFKPIETGYGHTSEEVAQVQVGAELLKNYHDAVHKQTVRYIAQLAEDDYKSVVDENWNPPVTRGARLISVVADDLQHAGQAAYVRGLLERRGEALS